MSDTPDYIKRTPTDADMAAAEADLMESPEFLRSEITRLRSALASMKEQCARVAAHFALRGDPLEPESPAEFDMKMKIGGSIAAAIRALPTEGHSQ
jgi:hypothetical protein